MAPTSNHFSKHKNGYNSVSHMNTELKSSVIVAE